MNVTPATTARRAGDRQSKPGEVWAARRTALQRELPAARAGSSSTTRAQHHSLRLPFEPLTY